MFDVRSLPKKRAHPVAGISRNLPEMFLKRTARTPGQAAWRRKVGAEWVTASWHDFYEAAASLATFLLDRGIGLSDKLTICGSTRPEWCIADVGGLLAGAITVGAYSTLTAEQLCYILDHSDSRVAFVEDREQLQKIIATKAELPKLELVVVWETGGLNELKREHGWIVGFDEVLRPRRTAGA